MRIDFRFEENTRKLKYIKQDGGIENTIQKHEESRDFARDHCR